MDLLPQIDEDIEDDINNLDMKEPETLVEEVKEKESPFIEKPTTKNTKVIRETEEEIVEFNEDTKRLTEKKKPVKKKRELTDKQKETLKKNREKALATRRAKAEAKKKAAAEAVEKIEYEKKMRKTAGKPKKADPPKTELDIHFEEKIQENEEERIAREQKEEEMQFLKFMANMEKFTKIKHEYNQKRLAQQPKPKPTPPPPKPKQVQKPSPPKPVIKPTKHVPAIVDDNDWFG